MSIASCAFFSVSANACETDELRGPAVGRGSAPTSCNALSQVLPQIKAVAAVASAPCAAAAALARAACWARMLRSRAARRVASRQRAASSRRSSRSVSSIRTLAAKSKSRCTSRNLHSVSMLATQNQACVAPHRLILLHGLQAKVALQLANHIVPLGLRDGDPVESFGACLMRRHFGAGEEGCIL